MRATRLLLFLCLLAGSACPGKRSPTPELPATSRPEPWRPQLHYSPYEAWMNDPNGLVVLDGEYHLFYQHYPYLPLWGEMFWGHAVSTDLVHWQELDIALEPDPELGMAFSGSAVVAHGEAATAVCGDTGSQACLVAIYTHHGGVDGTEKQSVAYSVDRGRTWTLHPASPVLPNPGVEDYRDPKVFWHAPQERWVMVLAAGDRVELHESADLLAWSPLSTFGPAGDTDGDWECPELLELPVEDGAVGETRWLLKVDVNRGFSDPAPASQYWVGSFDGVQFTADASDSRPVDYGADFYAAQSWSDPAAEGHRWIGWMDNWAYAMTTPTEQWRGAMTVVRELALRQTAGGVVLVQRPIEALTTLRAFPLLSVSDSAFSGEDPLLAGLAGETLELRATLDPGDAQELGFRLRVGVDEQTTLGYAPATETLFVDRTQSSSADPGSGFATRHDAPVTLRDGLLHLHVLVDWSSVEVFAQDGEAVITDRVFPGPDSHGLGLYTEGGTATLVSLDIYALGTIWPEED